VFTLLPLLLCSPVFSQDALGLFHKMQDALGGAGKIAAIHDLEQRVRAESWDGSSGRLIGVVHKRTRCARTTSV